MKTHHTRQHWIGVALVLAAAMLTLTEARGQQRSGAAAVFEGRPAMAGAQAGTGAMAGPPQGGIGVQGSQAAEKVILRKPAGLDTAPTTAAADIDTRVAAADGIVRRDRDSGGIAKEERSAVKKSKRAAKRVVKRARTGVGDIDALN